MLTGVLVLGYHREDGGPGLSALGRAAVRRAERVAAAEGAVVVVCSGFAPLRRPFPLRRVLWELRGLRWVPAFRRRLEDA